MYLASAQQIQTVIKEFHWLKISEGKWTSK